MDGGSGGGSTYSISTGQATPGQGYPGGLELTGGYAGSGGGGAGSAGTPSSGPSTAASTGPGGSGLASSITGTSITHQQEVPEALAAAAQVVALQRQVEALTEPQIQVVVAEETFFRLPRQVLLAVADLVLLFCVIQTH
jgi:hypothetical protein